MNIIFLSATKGRLCALDVCAPKHFIALSVVALTVLGLVGYTGYRIGVMPQHERYVTAWKQDIKKQKLELDTVKKRAAANVDALTSRMGLVQAHVTRLDALGQKLVKMAKLAPEEFNFNVAPAIGGPENPATQFPSLKLPELDTAVAELSEVIVSREQRLLAMENLLLDRKLQKEVYPTGRPVRKGGWISSYYGMRNHPLTGKREKHKGVDFASRRGAGIYAVASGVVTYSGKRWGYGTMVEVSHGNGYKTRYAHNQLNIAKVGETVRKGQLIANVGSTGRSTGPHVHFEVLKNGRQTDPLKFIQASR